MVFEHAKEEGNCQNVCVAIFTGTKSRLKIPEVGHLEGRGFLGLNPFWKMKYLKSKQTPESKEQLTISEILNFHSKYLFFEIFRC